MRFIVSRESVSISSFYIIVLIPYHCEFSTPSRNFFEMVRFDFILDADLKVWLMEVTGLTVGFATYDSNKADNMFLKHCEFSIVIKL